MPFMRLYSSASKLGAIASTVVLFVTSTNGVKASFISSISEIKLFSNGSNSTIKTPRSPSNSPNRASITSSSGNARRE